jgi:hypothetical protein
VSCEIAFIGASVPAVTAWAPDPPEAVILTMSARRKPGTAVSGRLLTPPKAIPEVSYASAIASSA